MSTFGFDPQQRLLGVTPVENRFLSEYMPQAGGDALKVYLLGLMHCTSPSEGLTVADFARELEMQEEDVLAAFRYWERRRLVIRISDRPPQWRFVPVSAAAAGGGMQEDPEFVSFSESVHAAFDRERLLHGAEIRRCYEWVEEMHIPQEAVIMMIRHLISSRGKNFSMKSADAMAAEMAAAGVRTMEDAEEFLSRDKAAYSGTRKLLARFGKRRQPSRDEMDLYTKWHRDWGYSHEAIEEACAETTAGDPSMKYLDGILSGIRSRFGQTPTAAQMKALRNEEKRQREMVADFMNRLGVKGTVSDALTETYRMLKGSDSDALMLMAADEARKVGGRMDTVSAILTAWREKGLTEPEKLQDRLSQDREADSFLQKLFALWERKEPITGAHRAMLRNWKETYRFSDTLIFYCAGLSGNADKPMPYLNRLLQRCSELNITTPEEAERELQQKAGQKNSQQKSGKTVTEQQYIQRDVTNRQSTMDDMIALWGREGDDA